MTVQYARVQYRTCLIFSRFARVGAFLWEVSFRADPSCEARAALHINRVNFLRGATLLCKFTQCGQCVVLAVNSRACPVH